MNDHGFQVLPLPCPLLSRDLADAAALVPHLATHAVAALEPAAELAERAQELVFGVLELFQQMHHCCRRREGVLGQPLEGACRVL